MSEGYIIANVYTSKSLIPIKDASVSVTKTGKDTNELIGFRKTNENGTTTPIIINTPDENLSLEPNYKEPFATCDIQIEHPMYYTIFIKNAQVFANRTTVQPAELIPLEDTAVEDNAVEVFDVNQQNL